MRRRSIALSAGLLLLLPSGCSGPDAGNDGMLGGGSAPTGGDPATDGLSAGTTGAASTTADGSGTAAGSSGGDGTKFDLAEVPDAPPAPEAEPCNKVDLLFVVDNSGSMAGEQQNLVDNFPGFVDEMLGLETLEDLHIGVISTEIHSGNPIACQKLGAFSQAGQWGTCTPYDSGMNWMTQAQTNLHAKFTCAAQLGTGGSGDEKPMDAMRLAISDAYNGAGSCNDGFMRDDALLVIVVITDEEDDNMGSPTNKSQGDPTQWFNAVVSHKGIETNTVVLSLVGQPLPNECNGIGFDPNSESAAYAPRLHEFTQMFTYGFLGDVCADDYQPFFHEAISVIDTACMSFTPPRG